MGIGSESVSDRSSFGDDDVELELEIGEGGWILVIINGDSQSRLIEHPGTPDGP